MYDWNDEADAERFVRTYADLILRLCLSHGLSRADAQDICQELFLKLLAAQRTFTSEEHEKAWVIRAAGNACKNLLRAPHHSRRALLEQAHTVAAPEASDHAILEAIRALPHRYRDAVALCCWEGYSAEEAARLPVPFTGVVGATARAAVDATRNGKVGIIGTAATVRSGSYAAVIKDMKPETEIIARACPMFVPLVENGYVNDGNPVTKLIIAEYLQEVKDAGVDTLILGCTHYPLLKKMIGDFMGSDVTLIDSGKVTAQAAAAALADLGLLNGRTEGGNAHYYVSDTPDNFDELEHRFLGEYAGGPVEQIAIETY